MSSFPPYYLEALMGNVPANAEVVHKFGQNLAVSTTSVAVAHGGIYRMPQVSGATKVRVKAGDVVDTALGDGARAIQIQGLDILGDRITEVIPTAGTSAGADSVNTYLRLFRAFVCESGTYADITTGSHDSAIVIENAAGTEDWLTINIDAGYPEAQSEVGWYTIPRGKTGFIISLDYSVDSTKITNLQLMARAGVLDTAAPYDAMRKKIGIESIIRDGQKLFPSPLGPFSELTDIGFLAKIVSAPATSVEVHFGILLRDNE